MNQKLLLFIFSQDLYPCEIKYMKIKRIFIVMLLMVAGVVNAQTQQGYVKTKGRLGSNGAVIKGTRLSGETATSYLTYYSNSPRQA